MSRQLDVVAEERETKRRDAVIRALEYSFAGAIEHQGGEFRGFAIQYGIFECLLTAKASFEGKWFVAHVASDSLTNCVLRAARMADHNALRWSRDKYQPDQD